MTNKRAVQIPLFTTSRVLNSLADVHTSKRGKHERRGVHAWHTYYAGYSEQFVEDVLAVLSKPDDIILDPWNGSGTTTLVAQRHGLRSVGVEINPVMVLHARAKNLNYSHIADDIFSETQRVLARAQGRLKNEICPSNPITEWVDGVPLTTLLAIKDVISETRSDFLMRFSFCGGEGFRSMDLSVKIQPFFLSALFQVLRKVGKFDRGSNPTWLLQKEDGPSWTASEIFPLFSDAVSTMLMDLELASRGVHRFPENWMVRGDARELPISSGTIDLIVTSPPYCTRIDYAFATKPELLLLSYNEEEVDGLRRATMGAPVIANKGIEPQKRWGETCNCFLEAVAHHSSKASQSYYLPIYVQYFRDAALSLLEVHRVLKVGGKAVIVVQSSFYKEVELKLGEIYVEMAKNLGFTAEIARREPVRQHMAHINTKSKRYVKKKIYYEDVILLHR